MKKYLWLLLAVLFAETVMATIPPQWLHKQPKQGNATYVFVPITVETNNLTTGRTEALKMLALDRGLLSSLKIQYKAEDITNSESQTINGKFSEKIDVKTIEATTFEGRPIQLKAQIIDEYLATKKQTFTTLYRVGIVNNPYFDDVSTTTFYAGHGLWRSAIVPGWGQFYKGSYLKGGLMLGGTVALAAGIIYTNSMRSDYANKIAKTHNTENKRTYATKRDNYTTGRNICIGGLTALYVYNLVDAIVAPGARRIIVHQSHDGKRNYSFEPTVLGDGSPGLTAAMTY